MCKKAILYSPGSTANVGLTSRGRSRKLNFRQISYSTDCVREYANIHDIPMAVAIGRLQTKNHALNAILAEARKDQPASPKKMAKVVSAFM